MQRAGSLPPGEYVVPGHKGLYLLVRERPARKDCSRTWLFRYSWGGKRVRMVLGALPGLTLAEAQAEARKHQDNIRAGIDPKRAIRRRQTATEAVPDVTGSTDPHSVEALAHVFLERHIKLERKRKRQCWPGSLRGARGPADCGDRHAVRGSDPRRPRNLPPSA